MKKFFLTLLAFFILAAGAAAGYWLWLQKNLTPWSLVPSHSIAVYQPNNFSLDSSEERKILKNLSALEESQALIEVITSVDSLAGETVDALNWINNRLLISFHHGEKQTIAPLYILDIRDLKTDLDLAAALEKLTSHYGFTISKRQYLGFGIIELSNDKSNFTITNSKGFLVMSFTPYLVEDALRMVDKYGNNRYTSNLEMQSAMQQNVTGEGRLYVNTQELEKLGLAFVNQDAISPYSIKHLSSLMYLDLDIVDDQINMTGFSIVDSAYANYLSSFSGKAGVGFELKNIIPERSSLVIHASFEKVEDWHRGLKVFWRKHKPSQLTRIGEIENKYGFDIREFYKTVGSEIGFLLLETDQGRDNEKVFCIQHQGQKEASIFYDQLAKSIDQQENYSEEYKGRQLNQLQIDDFPARLFGMLFEGFAETYYFIDRNNVYLGSSIDALHTLIDDIEEENTWRKSVGTNSFLEKTNEDANFSIYIKCRKFWRSPSQGFNTKWADYIRTNKDIFNQIEYAVVQFTNVDDKFYTNLSWQHPGRLSVRKSVDGFEVLNEIALNDTVVTKPFAVRNHNNGALEMMVQDNNNTLTMVSPSFESELEVSLSEPIISRIHQIDYYKNNKLQYLFATRNAIHMIDRTGNYIPGYPVKPKGGRKIDYLSLIDYDKSKRYRILIACDRGQYMMYDKTGKILAGWNPHHLPTNAAMPVRHFRLQSKDYLLAAQRSGAIYLLNRNSSTKKGFPVQIKGDFGGDVFLKKGTTVDNTELLSLSAQGELIVLDVTGKVLNRTQLEKTNSNDRFSLVHSALGSKCLVMRHSFKDVALIDAESQQVLMTVPLVSDQINLQYYDFGGGNDLFVLIDEEHHQAYFYDEDGNIMHQLWLNTMHEVAVVFQKSELIYEIYHTDRNLLKKVILNR